MRTTVTLDPDVVALLQEEARRQGLSFKQVLNQAVRKGLSGAGPTGQREPFRTQPHAFEFKAGIDLDKLNQLVDEIDTEAFAEKQARQ